MSSSTPPDPEHAGPRRVVLITGGSGLLGQAVAKTFAASNAIVVLAYHRNEQAARSLADSFGASVVQLDLTEEASVERAVAAIVKEHGRIDVLVNAAGVMPKQYLRFCTQADVQAAFATNTFGPVYACKAVLPHMSRAGWGRIVLVGSRSALVGMVSYSLYTASKAALVGLARSVSKECASLGITINVVAPARLEGSAPGQEAVKAKYPMGRFVRPEEVATMIAYLASEAAASITGQSIDIDGASEL